MLDRLLTRGPLLALVQDPQELQALAAHAVDDEITRSSDDELTSCWYAPRSTNARRPGEQVNSREDLGRQGLSCIGVIWFDVTPRLGQIGDRRARPAGGHPGGSSSSSVPQLCNQALTLR